MGEAQEPEPEPGWGQVCGAALDVLPVPGGVLGGRSKHQARVHQPGQHAGRALERYALVDRTDAVRLGTRQTGPDALANTAA
jgi:hypothetical protein